MSIWCFEHSWFSGFSVADEVCPQCDWMGGKEAGHIPRTHCIPWLLQVRLNKQSLYLHNYCAGKVHKVNSWWWIVFPIDTALHACSRLFQAIVVHLMLVGGVFFIDDSFGIIVLYMYFLIIAVGKGQWKKPTLLMISKITQIQKTWL